MASPRLNDHIRYEPEDSCSPLLALAVGAQGILILIAPTVLVIAITAFASGQDEQYLTWAVFAALIIVGIVTILQASRVGWLGAGHMTITGVTPNYIAVSVLALEAGGPSMLASLIVVSSIFYFGIAVWLPLLRRVITPVVSGTVLMIIAVMVLPICFDRLTEVPEGSSPAAGPIAAAVCLFVTTILILRAPRIWRPWSLLTGIVAGCVVAAFFGLFEFDRLSDAPWVGLPEGGFHGLDLTPTIEFWTLLPMFLVVTLIQAIKGIGDGMAIQQSSRRLPRATDFRLLQGSIYANGVGILLSGFAGTPPTSFYASFTASLVNLTGVAARTAGYAIGGILIVMVFFPKITGVLLIVPNPIMGAFLLFALGLLFVEGVQMLSHAGLDAQKVMVVGVSFAVGAGLLQQNVVEDLLGSPWGALLGSGITIGAATAIALTVLLDLTGPRSRRLDGRLEESEYPRVDAFLREISDRLGWDEASSNRLRSAGEETMTSLLHPESEIHSDRGGEPPRMVIIARPASSAVEMEFVAVLDDENLEDRLTYLDEQTETSDDREVSFRLLRFYASSVRHQKYHGMDIVTVQVDRT